MHKQMKVLIRRFLTREIASVKTAKHISRYILQGWKVAGVFGVCFLLASDAYAHRNPCDNLDKKPWNAPHCSAHKAKEGFDVASSAINSSFGEVIEAASDCATDQSRELMKLYTAQREAPKFTLKQCSQDLKDEVEKVYDNAEKAVIKAYAKSIINEQGGKFVKMIDLWLRVAEDQKNEVETFLHAVATEDIPRALQSLLNLLNHIHDTSRQEFYNALNEVRKIDGVGTFNVGGSIGANYIVAGVGFDGGFVIDIDYLIASFATAGDQQARDVWAAKYQSTDPIMTFVVGTSGNIGPGYGLDAGLAIGYDRGEAKDAQGPGMSAAVSAVLGAGAGVDVSFDFGDMPPSFAGVTVALFTGLKIELSVSGGWTDIVGAVCPTGPVLGQPYFAKDLLAMSNLMSSSRPDCRSLRENIHLSSIVGKYHIGKCIMPRGGVNAGANLKVDQCENASKSERQFYYESMSGTIRLASNPSLCVTRNQDNRADNYNNGNDIKLNNCAGMEGREKWIIDRSTGQIRAAYNLDKCIHSSKSDWSDRKIHLWTCDAEGDGNNDSWIIPPESPYLVSFDRRGNDIGTYNTQDAPTCEAGCAENGDCEAWLYNGDTGKCYFKRGPLPEPTRINCPGCRLGYKPGIMSNMQPGFSSPNSDYVSYTLSPPTNNAAKCEAECQRDGRCKSWEYIPQGSLGACNLKNAVQERRVRPEHPLAVSGSRLELKVAEIASSAIMAPLTAGIRRPGTSVARFRPTSIDPLLECEVGCSNDTRCDSWIYNPDGLTCYLLKDIPQALLADPNKNFGSGIKVSALPKIMDPVNTGTRRGGSELAFIDILSTGNPVMECQVACADDDQCQSWFYRAVDADGEQQGCYLKSDIAEVQQYPQCPDCATGKKRQRNLNLAAGKTVSQSSTAYGGDPSRAVDGNRDGVWDNNSVTHTHMTTGTQYWQVDLGEVYSIDDIKIYNRTDPCCNDRIANSKVQVLNGNTVVWENTLAENKPVVDLAIQEQVNGSAVRIIGPAGGVVSVAEVEVYGDASM